MKRNRGRIRAEDERRILAMVSPRFRISTRGDKDTHGVTATNGKNNVAFFTTKIRLLVGQNPSCFVWQNDLINYETTHDLIWRLQLRGLICISLQIRDTINLNRDKFYEIQVTQFVINLIYLKTARNVFSS